MAKQNWSYLVQEKRVGEYEELTLRSIGHWWMEDDPAWPAELRAGYHLRSETGVAIVEPTRLKIRDVGAFRDKSKLTYRSYVLQQDVEEKKLDAVLEGARQRGAFSGTRVPESITGRYIPAMRHFFWGAGMAQIYGSSYTPCSTVMNALLFQVFDSMRHAQRMVELSWEVNRSSGAPVDSKEQWLHWGPVQPMRRFVEYGLTVFDWAETLVAFNYVLLPILKPVHDALMTDIPESLGDWATAQFWLRLAEDVKRHLQVGEEFVAAMRREDPANHAVLQEWIHKWYPLAVDAIDGLAPLVEDANRAGYPVRYEQIRSGTLDAYALALRRHELLTMPQRSAA